MPVRRTTFRIEEMMQGEQPDPMPATAAEFAMCHHETLRELKALRAMVERHEAGTPPEKRVDPAEVQRLKNELHQLYETVKHTKQEIASLHTAGLQGGEMARVTNELGAVVGSTESASQRILAAAETIDENANALAEGNWNDHQVNLTQDIQEGVVRIFEACVFHDLTGQRISKVTAALKKIEEHVARMVDIWGGPKALEEYFAMAAEKRAKSPSLVNGPPLDDEADHVSQKEVDAIFSTLRAS